MRRIGQLHGLSSDHHTTLIVALRCVNVADEPAARSLWMRIVESGGVFELHIEPHITIEDEQLLPALDAIGEHERAARLRDEHAELRGWCARSFESTERVRDFGRFLERHVRYEERDVFQATQDLLGDDALAQIAEACERIPRSCVLLGG